MAQTLAALAFALVAFFLTLVVARVYVAGTYPEALVVSGVGLLAFAQVSSDVIGAVGWLTPAGIAISWGVWIAVLAALLLRRRRLIPRPHARLSRNELAAYGAVGFVSALTFVTGAAVAPNNWDSLTYHLSRAAHWLQQGSVDFFATPNARENVMSPLADIAIAHLISAGDSARWAFLAQWAAGVITIAGAGILAQHVFGSRRIVALTVMVAATVPMLLSQMSTTQADLVAGVPVAAGVVAWRWVDRGWTVRAVTLLGVAAGVAAAVKATSALLVLPWIVVVAVILVRGRAWRSLALLVGVSAAAGVVMNAGYAMRMLTQRSSGLESASDVLNGGVGVEIVGVNLLRDAASVLAVPLPGANRLLERLIGTVAEWVGWDLSLPAATFGSGFGLPTAWSEDHAAAPLHAVLAVTAIVVMTVGWRRFGNARAAVLIAVLAGQFLLIATAVRWQPWINRFSFLIVVFAAPLVGWLFSIWPRWLGASAAALMVLVGVAWVLLQPLRGLAGTQWIPDDVSLSDSIPRYASPLAYDRFAQHFMHHPPTAETYQQALDYAAALGPDVVQMDISGEWWEYPVWARSRTEDWAWTLTHDLGEGGSGRTVRVCIGDCSTAGLTDARVFAATGPPSPSVDEGPQIVVGVVPGASAPGVS